MKAKENSYPDFTVVDFDQEKLIAFDNQSNSCQIGTSIISTQDQSLLVITEQTQAISGTLPRSATITTDDEYYYVAGNTTYRFKNVEGKLQILKAINLDPHPASTSPLD